MVFRSIWPNNLLSFGPPRTTQNGLWLFLVVACCGCFWLWLLRLFLAVAVSGCGRCGYCWLWPLWLHLAVALVAVAGCCFFLCLLLRCTPFFGKNKNFEIVENMSKKKSRQRSSTVVTCTGPHKNRKQIQNGRTPEGGGGGRATRSSIRPVRKPIKTYHILLKPMKS